MKAPTRGVSTSVAVALLAWAGGAMAQFATLPAPLQSSSQPAVVMTASGDYRPVAARHVYASYPTRVFKGKLPPLLHAVMVTETQIDAEGRVMGVRIVRPPAAAGEVVPWVLGLIRRAAPYPAAIGAGDATFVWREVWLVDKTGRFQIDALSEGQR